MKVLCNCDSITFFSFSSTFCRLSKITLVVLMSVALKLYLKNISSVFYSIQTRKKTDKKQSVTEKLQVEVQLCKLALQL